VIRKRGKDLMRMNERAAIEVSRKPRPTAFRGLSLSPITNMAENWVKALVACTSPTWKNERPSSLVRKMGHSTHIEEAREGGSPCSSISF